MGQAHEVPQAEPPAALLPHRTDIWPPQRVKCGARPPMKCPYVAYAPVSLEPAPLDSEAWTRFLSGFVEAFPDLHLTVEDAVGEGDLVAQRVHFAGIHTGEFQGLPPTHRKVTFSGLELNRFVDGRVAEHWFQMDSLTLLQQLGLVVVPGPRLLPRVLAHQLKKLRKKR
jgi:predicted ester cyclase